jgi:hypothetical protein
MLVILTDEQVLSTEIVCQGCLLANQSGSPRWHQGRLSCGHCIGELGENQPTVYQCQMGFRLAKIE